MKTKRKMKIGKTYKIIVEIAGKELTYTAKVISKEDGFISIIDKFGNLYNYNKNKIVSYTESKEDIS